MDKDNIVTLKGERLAVGLSAIIGITLVPGQQVAVLKYFSGGSLEIGGSALTWGAGYLMGTSEVLNMKSQGTFYLAATGATAVAMLLRGKSTYDDTTLKTLP